MTIGQLITPTIRLVRKIGDGGQGAVWEAENLKLGSLVAVKLLQRGYEDAMSVARFKREGKLAARVQSPHVATIIDHGATAAGVPFIVMELVNGETLKERLARCGALPLDEVAQLVRQTAKGLAAAHRLNVVHRDIKPANLFILDNEGEPFVKVGDFGIAKPMDVLPDLTLPDSTTTNMMVGTPAYMSPEQYMNPKAVDLRTDLWSLGVVVYEAITGAKPFSGETTVALGITITKGVFTPPSARKSDVPKAADEWMAKALEVDPDKRFGSAMEMAEALSRAFNPSSGGRQLPPLVPAPPPPGDARTEPDSMKLPPLKLALTKEDKPSARPPAPPDSIKLPDAAPISSGAQPQLEMSKDTRRGFLSLQLQGATARVMAFDDGGKLLYVGFNNGNLLCMDLTTNQPRWWHQLVARPRSITTGGRWLAIGCMDGIARVFKHGYQSESGIVHKELIVGHSVSDVGLSSSGRDLAAIDSSGRMSVWSPNSGRRRAVAEQPGRIRCIAYHHRSSCWVFSVGDDTIHLWGEYLKPVNSRQLPGTAICSIASSPTGNELAIGNDDGSMTIFDISSGKSLKTLSGHTRRVTAVSFFLRGTTIVSTSLDGTARYWDLATGKLLLTLETDVATATSLAGSRSATAFATGEIYVYGWPIDPSLGRK